MIHRSLFVMFLLLAGCGDKPGPGECAHVPCPPSDTFNEKTCACEAPVTAAEQVEADMKPCGNIPCPPALVLSEVTCECEPPSPDLSSE